MQTGAVTTTGDPSAYAALQAEILALADTAGETTPVTRADQVPASAAMITPQWLTAILCADTPGAEVEAIHLQHATATHTQRRAMDILYNSAGTDAGLPRRLFSKSTAVGGRAIVRVSGATANEVGFLNLVDRRTGLETPHARYAAYDERSMRSMILMEDVTGRGAHFFTLADEMSVDTAKGILAQLATLHARWWDAEELDGEFRWLKSSSAFNFDIHDLLDYERVSMIGIDAAIDVLPPALAARKGEIWAAYEHSLRLSDRGARTFLHGDIHPGNTYKMPDGSMGLCDWQCTVKGNWARDVAYAITSFLPAGQRPLVERDLIAFYLDRLRVGGAPAPAMVDAWQAYRTQTLHSFISWAFTLGMALTVIEMQPPDICREILRRKGAAIDQLGTLAALAEAA